MERTLPLGSVYRGRGRCSFLAWAPAAQRVDLRILPPGGRIVTMQKLDCGYHGAEVDGVRSGSLYVYRLDGLIERPDPASRCQPAGPCGPSAIVDSRSAPNKDAWRGLALREYVVAEPSGNDLSFGRIHSRLDGLSSLGFTALRVPLRAGAPEQAGCASVAGFPFSVPRPPGGPAGLKRLVRACHRRGLAVMLAVDLFDPGIEGEPFVSFAPYFTGRRRRFNLDGPFSDEVRRYFIECVLSRFRETGTDALDIGTVDGISDLSPLPLLEEMACAVQDEAERIGRPLHLVARSGRNDPRLIRRREDGGLGLGAVWDPDFEEALHTFVRGVPEGADSDFGRLEHVQKAFLEGFVGSGGYSPTLRRRHGRSSRILPGELFLACVRSAAAPEGQGPESTRAEKLLLACLFLSPFLPCVTADPKGRDRAAFVAGLIRMRRELRSRGLLDKQCMGVLGYDKERVLLVRHWKDDEDLIVIFHFGTRASTVALPVPAGTWALRFDTADRRWNGPVSTLPALVRGDGGDVPFFLPSLSCAVYLRQHGA